jgi:preprotein translocase subunit YajC
MDSTTSTILMIVVMVFIFYYFLIRPENKKKKELDSMRENLKVGDRITTIGGISGSVCHINDDRVVIETGADRVRIELHKWAISTNETAAEAQKALQESQPPKKKGLFGRK